MHAKDIKVGKTYRNRGKGLTTRKVLAIGKSCRPARFLSDGVPPEEPGVLLEDSNGRRDNVYISSFARLAGSEVEE